MPVVSPHQGRGSGDEGAPGPLHRRFPPRLTKLLLAAAVATTLATACSESDGPSGPTAQVTRPESTTSTTPPPPETTTTTAPPTPEAKVEAAFLRADALASGLAHAPDPKDQRLAESYAGPSLEKGLEVLQGYVADGMRIDYVDGRPPEPIVEDVRMAGNARAFVTICVVDNSQKVRIEDEAVIDDAVISRRDQVEMRFLAGAWKAFAQLGIRDWPDGAGCNR